MGALEGGLVALVILFYIVRAIYRGLRWLVLGARRLVVPPQPPRAGQPAVPPGQAPPRPAPVPRPQPGFRRPETDAPAVPQPATDARFREQVAQMASSQEQSPQRPAERAPRQTGSDKITLRPDGKDLVRALIWQEILSPPRSQRGRRTPPQ